MRSEISESFIPFSFGIAAMVEASVFLLVGRELPRLFRSAIVSLSHSASIWGGLMVVVAAGSG